MVVIDQNDLTVKFPDYRFFVFCLKYLEKHGFEIYK